MGCANGVKPRKKVQIESNELLNQTRMEGKSMSSTMVRQEMPKFTMDAYDAKTGHFKEVSSDDYKGNGR
jgi:peroxiredoxin (alkyl hydroperoxide reductase subunit C)